MASMGWEAEGQLFFRGLSRAAAPPFVEGHRLRINPSQSAGPSSYSSATTASTSKSIASIASLPLSTRTSFRLHSPVLQPVPKGHIMKSDRDILHGA